MPGLAAGDADTAVGAGDWLAAATFGAIEEGSGLPGEVDPQPAAIAAASSARATFTPNGEARDE
jgi:hypothetical protein